MNELLTHKVRHAKRSRHMKKWLGLQDYYLVQWQELSYRLIPGSKCQGDECDILGWEY